MWDYHCAPMQIYPCALTFLSHPLVSAETFPWHLQRTRTALWVWARGGEMATDPPCWVQGGGLQMCGRRSYTRVVYRVLPTCGVHLSVVSVSDTNSLPSLCSVHRTMEYFGSEGTFKGYLVQIRMLDVVLWAIEAFEYIMCGLEVEGHVWLGFLCFLPHSSSVWPCSGEKDWEDGEPEWSALGICPLGRKRGRGWGGWSGSSSFSPQPNEQTGRCAGGDAWESKGALPAVWQGWEGFYHQGGHAGEGKKFFLCPGRICKVMGGKTGDNVAFLHSWQVWVCMWPLSYSDF